jgi:DNA-binding NtrC family response regulator
MPEVDGLSLLRASIELDPSRPVIVMTAYSAFDTAMEASGGGAFQYLMKPFRLDALARVLEQALKR